MLVYLDENYCFKLAQNVLSILFDISSHLLGTKSISFKTVFNIMLMTKRQKMWIWLDDGESEVMQGYGMARENYAIFRKKITLINRHASVVTERAKE